MHVMVSFFGGSVHDSINPRFNQFTIQSIRDSCLMLIMSDAKAETIALGVPGANGCESSGYGCTSVGKFT